MKISFTTKQESNIQQRDEFLKLTPAERVISFYRLMERIKDFPTNKKETTNSFVIKINA